MDDDTENSQSIGFLGPRATHTHAAARSLFGTESECVPFGTITAVFDAVAEGRVAHAVVPLENSVEGTVRETVDCLLGLRRRHDPDRPLPMIRREIELRVRHTLLKNPVSADTPRQILSHPQALSQCKHWLQDNYPDIEQVATRSTAFAAESLRESTDAFAVASRVAADEFGLDVVAENIADCDNNTTRFAVISDTDHAPTGSDRTSLVLTAPHEKGALYRTLQLFDEENVNLTRIESRPLSGKKWEYAFMIEVDGHRDEKHLNEVIEALEGRGALVRVLGSYPRSMTP